MPNDLRLLHRSARCALIGIPPVRRLLVEGRDHRRRRTRPARRRLRLFMVVGLVGAFLTAAYMTRCVYHLLRRVPRPRRRPHESPDGHDACRSSSSPRWPSWSACVNIPAAASLDHASRSTCSRPSAVPAPRAESASTGAPRSSRSRSALLGVLLSLPVLGAAQGPVHRAHRAGRRARRGCTGSSRTSTTSTSSTDIIVGTRQGPDRRRRLLVQPARHRRCRRTASARGAVDGRRRRLRRHRPEGSSTASSTGSGAGRRGVRPGAPPDADRQGPAVRRAALRRRRDHRRASSSSSSRSHGTPTHDILPTTGG